LAEILIVVVILGLVAAMAIPAFEKVRRQSILKAGDRGEKLTPSQREVYREMKRTRKVDSQPVSVSLPFEKVRVGDREFYLVRKPEEQMQVNGEIYWLVPVP
jgi:hypothetical protein